MNKFLKIFSTVFLGIGVLFFMIGLAWLYRFMNEPGPLAPDDEWVGPFVFIFIGLVFSAIGGGILYYQAK